MLFFSFFKTLVDQEVTVELKNDIEIKGTLKSVDQFLNLKLDNISCANESKYPHLRSVKNLFIRGSTVRYVHMSANSVDCTLLQDASRRGMFEKDLLATSCILTISQKPWSKPPSKEQIIFMYYRRGASCLNISIRFKTQRWKSHSFAGVVSLLMHFALVWPTSWQYEQDFLVGFEECTGGGMGCGSASVGCDSASRNVSRDLDGSIC